MSGANLKEQYAAAVSALQAWNANGAAMQQRKARLLNAGLWLGRAIYGADTMGAWDAVSARARGIGQIGVNALMIEWIREAQALRAGCEPGALEYAAEAAPAAVVAAGGLALGRLAGLL